jgi:hypothetical protein
MALVGAAVLKCSRSAIAECVIKSKPLGMPIPNWPWGSGNWAALEPSTVITSAAVMRHEDEPMPSGRTLSWLFGSLCKAKK